MKRIILNLLISFIVTSSLNGQNFGRSNIYGRWYLIDKKTGTKTDTMIFKREMVDSSYNEWNFNRNDTLSISSGYTKSFDKVPKFYILKAHNYYKFTFGDSADKVKNLKIIKDNYTEVYSILVLDNNNLKIIKEKSFALGVAKKSHIEPPSKNPFNKVVYYFPTLKADASIFQEDSLILSKEEIDIKSPFVELLEDSTFLFCFNINLDTIKKKDLETGLLIDVIIDKSKKIHGTWKTSDNRKSISLFFKDENPINYSVINKKNLVYFIRIK